VAKETYLSSKISSIRPLVQCSNFLGPYP